MSYDQRRVLDLLKDSLTAEATDILIKVPARPMFRSADRLLPTPYPPMRPADSFQMAQSLLQLARREMPLATVRDESFAFGVQGVGRFRAHLYRQRGSIGIVIHRMVLTPPTLESLGAPALADPVAWGGEGLTLVTGQRERLALLAGLTDSFNTHHSGHLISLEDPVEFLHRDRHALISQREVGEDTDSLLEGLNELARESPDAVILHDIPNWQTAEAALRVAEGGLAVVASIAGCRAIEATRWFARMFPQGRESEIAERLCVTLRGVISEEKGRISVLPVSPPVREAILRRRPLPIKKPQAA